MCLHCRMQMNASVNSFVLNIYGAMILNTSPSTKSLYKQGGKPTLIKAALILSPYKIS